MKGSALCFAIVGSLLLIIYSSHASESGAEGAKSALEEQLRRQIDQFSKADATALPVPGQVLFVGSSSIAAWTTLGQDMAPVPVINRGVGGAQIEHINHLFDVLVARYRPRSIVFYAGENDLDAGKSVARVIADFDTFMARKSEVLGKIPVYFISLKPSKRRFEQYPRQAEVNGAVRTRADRRDDLFYIDVVDAMLEQRKPKDLFLSDGLHMNSQGYAIWRLAIRGALVPSKSHGEQGEVAPRIDENGSIRVPAFVLPESTFLGQETRVVLKRMRASAAEWKHLVGGCPAVRTALRADIPAIRKCRADAYFNSPLYREFRKAYAVTVTPKTIGGVVTESFTPAEGVAPHNKRRLLINLHGGGFEDGSGSGSHVESIPIAAVGKIQVISIDYRLGPEYTFPAASEDVASVYRELIKTYKPGNIGIYGCSSGAVLTSQSMAWFLKAELPLPGAISMLCHGAPMALNVGEGLSVESERSKWIESDSSYITAAIFGENHAKNVSHFPYYVGAHVDNPLASPGDYDEVMSKFPPTLLLSGGRDFTLSATLVTHAQLVRLGVPAQLHVWEGMSHGFMFSPDLREAREAQEVLAKFFDAHLGT
jgi:epsilon-lactone hydrolase